MFVGCKLGWETNERVCKIVTIMQQASIPKAQLLGVPCFPSRCSKQAMVRGLLVPSLVATLGRVRFSTTVHKYSHTNRLIMELTVTINDLRFTLAIHTIMNAAQNF